MKRGWQAAVAVLLLVFAFFGYESLRLSLRDALGPGPGFFPFWLSLAGGALGLTLLLQIARGSAGFEIQSLKFELRPVALVLAGLAVATAALEWLGFRPVMLLLLVYLLLALGARNWVAITLFALAGSFGVYHLFGGLLKVPLP
jgi:putative tricarboxylic transport membrane protein